MLFRFALTIALSCAGSFAVGVAHAQAPDLSKLDLVERCVPDGPIAKVDGTPIPRESFLYLYRSEVATLAALQRGDGVKDADRISTAIACVTELVQREILVSEAAKRGISVSSAETEEAYKKEIGALQESLAKSGKKKTEAEILADGGRTREDALMEMQKALLIERVRASIVKEKGVTVSDAEIKDFYEKNQGRFLKGGGVHLKQIFTRPKPDAKTASEQSWQEARTRIEKAIGRVQAGENFEAVAKAVSEAPNADNGGDLGVAPLENVPPFYREAIAKMKVGELSPIIKSEFGLHVILLVSVEDEKTVTLDDVKERVRKVLLQGKAEGVVDEYCRPIYDNTDRVQMYLSLERAIASVPESERPSAPKNAEAKPAASKPAASKPAAEKPAATKKSGKKGAKNP